jgi:hypothetical protein
LAGLDPTTSPRLSDDRLDRRSRINVKVERAASGVTR